MHVLVLKLSDLTTCAVQIQSSYRKELICKFHHVLILSQLQKTYFIKRYSDYTTGGMVRGSNLARQEIFLFSKMSTQALWLTQPFIQRVVGLFPEGVAAGA